MEFKLLILLTCFATSSLFISNVYGSGKGEESVDAVMREDAEEVFYNVNVEKYNKLGIKCPEPKAPENGFLIGEGTRVGTVLYIQCKDGFFLDGPVVMSCYPMENKPLWYPDVDRACVKDSTDSHDKSDSKLPELVKEDIDFGERLERQPEVKESSTDFIKSPGYFDPKINPRWAEVSDDGLSIDEDELENEDLLQKNQEALEKVDPICLSKPDIGPCGEIYERFYFDKLTMECHEFIYGGCQGNENNFETIEECNDVCLGKLYQMENINTIPLIHESDMLPKNSNDL